MGSESRNVTHILTKTEICWAKQYFTLSWGYINQQLHIVRAVSHAVSYPGFFVGLYLFIHSLYPPTLPHFLPLFFFYFLHIFPSIELSVFLAVCFHYAFVLESHIKQDVTLRLYVSFSITLKQLLTAIQVKKTANWQILVVLVINLWKYFRLDRHAICCC